MLGKFRNRHARDTFKASCSLWHVHAVLGSWEGKRRGPKAMWDGKKMGCETKMREAI